MKNLLDLSGRSAVIFGGTGNLGSFITKKLYENGAKVAVSYYFDREAEIAQKQLAALDPTGENVFAGYADIADRDSVEAFVADVCRKFSTIDIMVNTVHNPAFTPKDVYDMEWSDWKTDLDAQKGHFNACKSVLPAMREQQYGRIIYISGGLAVRHMASSAAFACVKGGMTAFNRTLAIEEGRNNITVNIVAPGKITSLDTDGAFAWDDAEAELLKQTPLGRFATQEEVANTVLYFASPLADAMTGQILYVACGELMR